MMNNQRIFGTMISSVTAVAILLGSTPALAIDAQPAKAVQTTSAVETQSPLPASRSRGGFMGNVFGCEASGSKQEIGAIAGAAVGGLLGNRIAGSGSRTIGTILGGALGGVAGSWLGCKLQRNDQVKAQRAVERGAIEGKDQTWSSDETGASGDVKVSQGTTANDLSGLKLASGVEPATAYNNVSGSYVATSAANVRSAPGTNARVLGQLPSGTQIWVPAGVKGSPWMLISRDGVGQGYVSSALLKRATTAAASKCRMIEHTVHTAGNADESEKLQACPGANGEWVMSRV
jgi:outer membrane lipoprotein SlyB